MASRAFSSAAQGSAAYFNQNIGMNWQMERNTTLALSQMSYLGISLVRELLSNTPVSQFASA